MKRAILLLLILCLLAGCSGEKGPATGTAAIEKLETIGDAIELQGATFEQSALYGETFLYAFSLDDTYYRVTAWTPPDIADAMWVLDRTAPDFKDQLNGLAKSQPIRTYENLSDRLLKPEDREKLDLHRLQPFRHDLRHDLRPLCLPGGAGRRDRQHCDKRREPASSAHRRHPGLEAR